MVWKLFTKKKKKKGISNDQTYVPNNLTIKQPQHENLVQSI